ncbi:hypothetical protein KJ611_01295 [Patescibacteria group bacterium]|nr:hypothetical protein [Patescibacteria group bacterium]MBU1705363.1 hypothetical protein [Patescibacteria group bacterium]
MNEKEEKKTSLKLEILEKVTTLAAAGFGLVAALAWNSAIQELFVKIWPLDNGSLTAKFIYAAVITVIVVVVVALLGRSADRLKNKLN